MAVISIDATSSGSTGVNINAEIADFDADFSTGRPPSNSGVFSSGGSQYDEYGIQPNSATGNNALVAGGDFTYVTGTLSGTLDSVSFGNGLLDNGAAVPYNTSSFAGGDLSLSSSAFTVSNIGLSGSGSGNALNSTFFGLLQGNPAAFQDWLFNNASNSIAFTGSAGADTITGSIGADVLNGNGGNDVLNGGAGQDTLNGGNGNDIFVFSSVSDSAFGSADTITQFAAGGNGVSGFDKIDVSAITGINAFSGSGAAANSIWYDAGNFYADTDGNASTAEFQVSVSSLTGVLDSTDFLF